MDTPRADDLNHRQALEILPWYVKHQLGPEESKQMDAHLASCAACRREAEGLATMFTAHEQSIPERPVDEARLDALFARIDAYEASRPKAQKREERSTWRSLGAMFTSWLTVRPAYAASALAVVLAVAVAMPLLNQKAPNEFEVLSGVPAAFSVTFQMKTAQNGADIERMILAGRSAGKLAGKYRIEQRSATEYTVLFEEKPEIAAVSELMGQWQMEPQVAGVAVDSGPATR